MNAILLLALKVTILFGLAGGISLLLRRARAAARHYVWGLALLGALALPAVALVSPRVAVPVLPAPIQSSPDPAQPAGVETPATAVAPAPSGPPTGVADRAAVAPARGALPWGPVLWAGGTALLLALTALSVAATSGLARRAAPVLAGPLADDLRLARAALGLRRPVRLLLGASDAMPMTWGVRQPCVLLPAAAVDWSPLRRRDVLLHELAHVRRLDWLTQLGARVVCAVYWWHPLAWYAARQLRQEREHACDDLVLAHGAVAEDYAHHLLAIARGMRSTRRTALAGVAMARPSQLAGRLLAVLDRTRVRAGLTRPYAGTAAALAAVLVLPVAGLTAVAAHPDKAADKEKPAAASAVAGAQAPTSGPAVPVLRDPRERTAGVERTLCTWDNLGSARSSHSNIDDDRVTITIIVDGCELSVRSRGSVQFSDDERDVAQLGIDAWFEIEERAPNGGRRRAEFERRGGTMTRRWYVDGREQTWDADAASWFQGALLVAFRRTSFQARERAARIYQRGGGEALLAEIQRLYSSSAIMAYLELYADRETLTSEEARRIARVARERISSSSNLSRVLQTLLRNPGIDDAARADIIAATDGISSSSARAEVLVTASTYAPLTPSLADAVLVSAGGISSSSARGRVLTTVGERLPVNRPLPESYLRAARGISSSSVLGEVLVSLLTRDQLSAAQVTAVLQLTTAIGSSSVRGRVLTTLLARHRLVDATRAPFFTAVRSIGSTSVRGEVLRALAAAEPDATTVASMLEATGGIGSSTEQASVLVAIAEARLLSTETLRTQYLRTANAIGSRSARERALRAIGAL